MTNGCFERLHGYLKTKSGYLKTESGYLKTKPCYLKTKSCYLKTESVYLKTKSVSYEANRSHSRVQQSKRVIIVIRDPVQHPGIMAGIPALFSHHV